MPKLPLGRLFWKFLIFFFLAQMTGVLSIGLAIWATRPSPGFWPPPPPAVIDGVPRDASGLPRLPGAPRPPDAKLPVVHLLAGALISLIFAALLAGYVSRPIRRLRSALQAGASGQLTPGLSAAMGKRRDELADLGQDFDRMARHLAQLMEGQRRLLHDVSHELRSPLARLNAIIGLARQQPDYLDESLTRLEHESQRMDKLLSELLTLSRLESGLLSEVRETVDLGELLRDVVHDAAPEIRQVACQVDLTIKDNAEVCGDPELLHRVFDNLLRNALLYASTGGWVGIRLWVSAGEAVVAVEDQGPGVSSVDLDRLFVPFYRGRHDSGSSGHGLGLAIAQQVVHQHKGSIDAANRAEGGLRLSVSLPTRVG